MNTFKIVLCGDAGVGKTTFVKRHLTGEFTTEYDPTVGVEVTPLTFKTNKGKYTLNVWDIAGDDRFADLRDEYFIKTDGAIIMYDMTDKTTEESLSTWYRDVIRVAPDTKFVLVGTKYELGTHVTEFHRTTGLKLYPYSSKTNYNFERPFLTLLRDITGHQDLRFIE